MLLLENLKLMAKHGKSRITLPLAHNLIGPTAGTPFIVSYPRSGSTWLRTILCNVMHPWAKGDPRIFNEKIPSVNLRNVLLVRSKNSQRSIIQSHTPFRNDLSRVLCLIRDGRDAIVSHFHYTTTRIGKEMSFASWFELYQRGFYGIRWNEQVESWLVQGRKRLGSRFLVMRFEDLKRDTSGCVLEALSFFDIRASDRSIEEAIQNASLAVERKWEEKFLGKPASNDASFYRGGSRISGSVTFLNANWKHL